MDFIHALSDSNALDREKYTMLIISFKD